MQGQTGKRLSQAARGRLERRAGNVDRHVGRRRERADDQTRLHRFSAAELDERGAAPGEARDLPQARARESKLRARRVVLGKPADALEEPAARRVGGVLGRERLLRAREARKHVMAEAVRRRTQPGWPTGAVLSSHLRRRLAAPMREYFPQESSSTTIMSLEAMRTRMTRQRPASLM